MPRGRRRARSADARGGVSAALPMSGCFDFGPETQSAEVRPRDPDVTGGFFLPIRARARRRRRRVAHRLRLRAPGLQPGERAGRHRRAVPGAVQAQHEPDAAADRDPSRRSLRLSRARCRSPRRPRRAPRLVATRGRGDLRALRRAKPGDRDAPREHARLVVRDRRQLRRRTAAAGPRTSPRRSPRTPGPRPTTRASRISRSCCGTRAAAWRSRRSL